ncbi:DUF4157 domain-containing protein [Streptomyces formicae]|uniref:eCIS core domain-containing protein n=1 Tax=Streptomyces formicae TaxID=1616117 RepID=A0A291QM31_9ACTN|nr:DUF4157 domain-containing protein [Streptomyces formicae]ATL32587.1 hypothetical protein KY5_7569c [Streptomyces formicae]
MEARQRSGDEPKADRPTRSTQAKPPTGLLALQRSAGNAAVTAFLRRAGMAAPPDEPQVQRMAVHDVLRAPGRPMDPALRDEMEQRFDGSHFDSVRFHTGTEAAKSAAELGAQAYTAGTHIVFNEGVERDKHVVAHELAHAQENMRGSSFKAVPYGDGVNVSEVDGASEIAAEATARRVMGPSRPSAHTQGHDGADSPPHGTGTSVARAAAPSVQRALSVGDTDFTAIYKRDTENLSDKHKQRVLHAMVNQVNVGFNQARASAEFTPEEVREFAGERERIQYQLAKAIVSPVGEIGMHPVLNKWVGSNKDFGAKNHDIRVNDYAELARNLMGWVYAKGNRHKEKVNAQAMHGDENLHVHLDVLLRRLYDFMKDVVPQNKMMDERNVELMEKELVRGVAHIKSQPYMKNGKHDPEKAGKPVGSYLAHFDGKFRKDVRGTRLDARIIERGGLLEVMKQPHKYGLREKMISLHDLSEYFGPSLHTPPTQGKNAFEDIRGQEKMSTVGWDRRGNRLTADDRGQNPQFHDDGSRKRDKNNKPVTHPSTRNENSETTKLARGKRAPVWAGQSYTAGRMFKMAKESGASTEEITAVAWGIFAFWRTDFDHTTEFAYHTLHEVMDIAQNFGVHYDMDDSYGSYRALDIERVAAGMSTLAGQIDALYHDAADRAEWMKAQIDARGMATDRDEEILANFRYVRKNSGALGNKLKMIADSLRIWSSLNSKDQARTLRTCIDDGPGWQREVTSLQSLLARASRR